MESIRIIEKSIEEKEREALLTQCFFSCKVTLKSFAELFPMMADEKLSSLVFRYRHFYEACEEKCGQILGKQDTVPQKGNARPHSFLSTQVKLAFRSDSSTLALLLFDGCHQVIRDLYVVLHRSQSAEGQIRRIAYRLIGITEDLRDELKDFL